MSALNEPLTKMICTFLFGQKILHFVPLIPNCSLSNNAI